MLILDTSRIRYLILVILLIAGLTIWQHGSKRPTPDITSSENGQLEPLQPVAAPVTQLDPRDAKLHVVVSHHDEEPYWIGTWLDDLRALPVIQSLGLYVVIYTKGKTRKPVDIQAATNADLVVPLPNVGREGSTYLHHILSHWDDETSPIAPLTLFTQSYLKKAQETSGPATGHLMSWLQNRISTTLSNSTGFMSLDRKHDICHCGHCTDMGRDDFYPLWPQLYTYITGQVCQRQQGHILSFNGHFVVSRARIRSRPRKMYEYLQTLVDAGGEHWIHGEPEPTWFEKAKGYKSRPDDPKFGHTLERLWHTIFACDRPEVVRDCDVAEMKAEGKGGCSCLDEPGSEDLGDEIALIDKSQGGIGI